MLVEYLRAWRFRNLEEVELDPGTGINLLYGDNAQGKTNILEALYVLSNLQSFRTRRIRDLVQSGAVQSAVEGRVEGSSGPISLRVKIGPEGREAEVDGKPTPAVGSYLTQLSTVLFSPLDLDLSRGNQELRRRFLDRSTFLADPGHLPRLRSYNRALRQRNALLRSGKTKGLAVWDDEVCRLGAAVHGARQQTLEPLMTAVNRVHRDISGGLESMGIECAPGYEESGDRQKDLRRALEERRETDLRLGFTGTGPHRDTVTLKVDGRDVERFGSQGQMRTVALSLKLGLLVWGAESLGEAPVFLLDDPSSELDGSRLGYLGRILSEWKGQVMITCTDRGSVPIPSGIEATYYRVSQGRVSPD
ncbi:MAG: DNA replication/repair protein RecF [Deferrisomatales bacterium]